MHGEVILFCKETIEGNVLYCIVPSNISSIAVSFHTPLIEVFLAHRFVFLGTIPIVLLYWISYFVIMTRPSTEIKGVEHIQERTPLIRGGNKPRTLNRHTYNVHEWNWY